MSKSLKKNYIYNMAYQVITIILPLITVPYISRVLKPMGIGLYAFTYSIVQYFILFGTLGINAYGNRTIAYYRDDKFKLSKVFWELTFLKLISTLVALILYILIFCTHGNNKTIYFLQSLNILAVTLDITYLFIGLEDFEKVVTRNIIIKIFSLVCILLFVRTVYDIWIYVLIIALSNVFGQAIMWLYIKKSIVKVSIKDLNLTEHIVATMQYFLPSIITQIYLFLDKTMLGYFSSIVEVAYYENAEKIVKLSITLVTSLGTIMLPRIANLYANGEIKKVNQYLIKSFRFSSYLSWPLAFGLAAISRNLVPWFFGKGFEKVTILMPVLTVIVIAISYSNVIGVQYLLPLNRMKQYTISVTISAMFNFLFNILLITRFKSLGVTISTIIAECIATSTQLYFIRKDIKIKILFYGIWKPIFSSMLMFFIVYCSGYVLAKNIIGTMVQIIIGVFVYMCISYILKDPNNDYIFKILNNRKNLYKFIKTIKDKL